MHPYMDGRRLMETIGRETHPKLVFAESWFTHIPGMENVWTTCRCCSTVIEWLKCVSISSSASTSIAAVLGVVYAVSCLRTLAHQYLRLPCPFKINVKPSHIAYISRWSAGASCKRQKSTRP